MQKAALRALLVCSLSMPMGAFAQSGSEGLCGASDCPSTNDEYASRLRLAYESSATTPVQRLKIRQIVEANRTATGIKWQEAASAYFIWRNGSPYKMNDPNYIEPNQADTLVKRYMSNRLKDPDSAKWQLVKGLTKLPDGSGYVICYSINAKNSYGAYSGNIIHGFHINSGMVDQSISDDISENDNLVRIRLLDKVHDMCS